MAHERKDRVKDQSSTTGTGTLTIDAVAPTGYRTIAAAYTDGATLKYTIISPSLAEWEVGQGVWTAAGSTLTRVTVYASSNAGALVNFSAGTKIVFTGPVANDLTGSPTMTAFEGATTLLTLGGTGATSVVNIPGTKASTISTDGSVTFAGGIGVAGNSNFGGTLGVTGVLTATGGLVLPGTAANITTGANFISYGGTDAGLSFDSSNNATLSADLTVTDQLLVSGIGPHAIGGALAADIQFKILGAYTATGADVAQLAIGGALNVPANSTAQTAYISSTINKAGSGVHSNFTTLTLYPPAIGAGGAALTNATTLKITGAPTGATNNYPLWIDADAPRFDEPASAGSGVGTLTNVPNAGGGNPAVYFKFYQGTTAYAIPGFAL